MLIQPKLAYQQCNLKSHIIIYLNNRPGKNLFRRQVKLSFNLGYFNHQKSFNFLKYRRDTKLSITLWWMKESGQTRFITFEVAQNWPSNNLNSKKYYLRLNENWNFKLTKIKLKKKLKFKCRHRNKCTLFINVTRNWL